jgi:hypothetical protein
MIGNDLSPENLSCDGEATAAYVRKRAVFLRKVVSELNILFLVEIVY